MLTLAVALAVLILVLAAMKYLSAVRPDQLAKALKFAGLAGLVGLGLFLVLTGKLAGLLAVAAGLGPWIARGLRLAALYRMVMGLFGGNRAGGGNSSSSPPASNMGRDEAYRVLGLEPGAAPEAIRAAHKRLMLANHPDHGGSDWIAARLNQARDVLLG